MPDASDIGYCTNVHPGDTPDEVLDAMRRVAVGVRRALGDDELPVGVWLPATAAGSLARDNDAAAAFGDALRAMGLRPYTVNGFPYGDFHAPVVKHRVYTPQWSDPRRTRYTMDLARVLARLLPEGARASISTVPIGWPGNANQEAAGEALRALHDQLRALHEQSGRFLTVDLEPEPGCTLDTRDDVLGFFERELPRHREHLGVCHDVCHAAVMFESQAHTLAEYARAGIRVNKLQVSSVPRVGLHDRDPAEIAAMLEPYREPRYLHQSTIGSPDTDGPARFFEDLPDLLASLRTARATPGLEARFHFHVPVHFASIGPLGTTQDQIAPALAAAAEWHPGHSTEVETYAWNVLPSEHRPSSDDELAIAIAEEIRWVRKTKLA